MASNNNPDEELGVIWKRRPKPQVQARTLQANQLAHSSLHSLLIREQHFQNNNNGTRPRNVRSNSQSSSGTSHGSYRGRGYFSGPRSRSSTPSILNNHQNVHWNPQPSRGRGHSSGPGSRPPRAENTENKRGRGGPFFGFKMLQNLLNKSPENIIQDLLNSRQGLIEHFQNDLSEDFYVMIVEIFAKISDFSFIHLKQQVYHTYLNEKFIKKLTSYVSTLPLQDHDEKRLNSKFWNNSDSFWNNLIQIFENILNETPHFAFRALPLLMRAIQMVLPRFEQEHSMHIADDIQQSFANISKRLELISLEMDAKNVSKSRTVPHRSDDEREPPNDFRDISVYPSVEELLNSSHTFLRENIVEGAYRDVNHYLDVQYRLLREDFVSPLRKGIQIHLNNTLNRASDRKRLENIKIHNAIQFLCTEVVNEDNCYRIKFDFGGKNAKKKSFKYEYSKNFMFGSLLCFTSDNFRTMIFGKVAQRDVKDLEKGELVVGFSHDVNDIDYSLSYLMVECGVYFEPYFHVLTQLKRMKTEMFPMEKYIIRVETQNVDRPRYLEDAGIETNTTPVSIEIASNLNDSQKLAFNAALDQEMVVIQGPPGTGKTHLALKISQALIANKDVWFNHTPMLVICYTNHALDQFLEGVSAFTKEIIRVGGQSKNEKLNGFNLKSRDNRMRGNSGAYLDARRRVQSTLNSIRTLSRNLNGIYQFGGIVDLEAEDEPFVGKYKVFNGDNLVGWLTGWNYYSTAKTKKDYFKHIVEPQNKDNDEETDENPSFWDDIFDNQEIFEKPPLFDITANRKLIDDKANTLQDLKQQNNFSSADLVLIDSLQREITRQTRRHQIISQRLADMHTTYNLTQFEDIAIEFDDPFALSLNDRWSLYFHCLNRYRKGLLSRIEKLKRDFHHDYTVYEDLRNIEDFKRMQQALVVGMTTTGAARLRSTLELLKCPIVIVEEAAEVLEAHITSALTHHCRHLILIGDHQQLKPSTADFSIENRFKLGISLFERMVRNNIQCFTLNVQHRMKPEIAALITPTIYANLLNHESVEKRERIRGIDKSLYFINHENAEDTSMETSKKNTHEVGFLIQFARHLILNGYEPENITILAAYLGQMFEFQKEKKLHSDLLAGVRVAVLDNYQGEESDIVLLSLVRSNDEARVGFLKIANRVCVALSRARDGLFIMGNMKQLCQSSEIWPMINRSLEQGNNVGDSLVLRCEIHRERETAVRRGEDFLSISEGGCDQICGVRLLCGHRCTLLCHVLDREHAKRRCAQPCKRKLCDLDELHVCRKMCFEECGRCDYKVERRLACGHSVVMECKDDVEEYQCPVLVETKLPCEHTTQKPCCRDAETFNCPFPCESRVEPCGHACLMNCHVRKDPDHLEYKCTKKCERVAKNCTAPEDTTEDHLCRKACYEPCEQCTVRVRKQRTVCPHFYDVPCHFNADELDCEKPCTKLLDCQHKCKAKCNEPCTLLCDEKVTKTNPICGHPIKVKCHQEPERRLCFKKCPLKLPCGHDCTKKCNEPCTSRCKIIVDSSVALLCGHTSTKLPCYLLSTVGAKASSELMKHCRNPCGSVLKCGHGCSGTCGECYQGRVHKKCSQKCGLILVCNHECTTPCRQACKPCTRPCSFKCKHSKCKKKCGEICTPCKERCERNCEHRKCTKACSAICEVAPCVEPCPKKLKCGHACIGFCGDPCPPKCVRCDRDEVLEVFFGTEEEDSRFVYLNDCEHILESEGLEQWLSQSDGEIGFKACPKCKSLIKTTVRYSDQIKMAMEDVVKVKSKHNGTLKRNEETRDELVEELTAVVLGLDNIVQYCAKLESVLLKIDERLQPSFKGKRQNLNKSDLNAIRSKIQILGHISQIFEKNKLHDGNLLPFEISMDQVEFIASILLRPDELISNQEIDDIQAELDRLTRIVQYNRFKVVLKYNTDLKVNQLLKDVEQVVFSYRKFSHGDDAQVKGLLDGLNAATSYGMVGISDREKREIVAAIGLQKGHWYKCQNGHPYAIGECGGAMMEAKCFCGAPIGGRNHSLRSDNRLASEMDGATHAAWGEIANNLRNFNLN